MVKSTTPKKAIKKVAKKTSLKTAVKKVAKKAASKTAVKKVASKTAAKKAVPEKKKRKLKLNIPISLPDSLSWYPFLKTSNKCY